MKYEQKRDKKKEKKNWTITDWLTSNVAPPYNYSFTPVEPVKINKAKTLKKEMKRNDNNRWRKWNNFASNFQFHFIRIGNSRELHCRIQCGARKPVNCLQINQNADLITWLRAFQRSRNADTINFNSRRSKSPTRTHIHNLWSRFSLDLWLWLGLSLFRLFLHKPTLISENFLAKETEENIEKSICSGTQHAIQTIKQIVGDGTLHIWLWFSVNASNSISNEYRHCSDSTKGTVLSYKNKSIEFQNT